MLVLSRKTNESIVIGDSVEVMIVDVKGDQVKLGISAPKSIKVFRKEIYEDITRQNREAMVQNADALRSIGSLLKKKDKGEES